jgi:medium-chain acyl-[acyl-carrier-protein] hydrolase
MSNANTWIAYSTPNPGASFRLFCFPYAGGGASIYQQWNGVPLDQVEVCPIQLPGRESRMAETPFRYLGSLASAVADILPQDKPFAFFGHSVGALLSFELSRELRRRGSALPFHLFVAGASAPHLCPDQPPRFNLPREELLVRIRELGGTPEAALANAELLDIFLPILRADFALFDTYSYENEAPFLFPITAMAGDGDAEVDTLGVRQWHIHTRNRFRCHEFHGNHFFLHQHSSDVRVLIAKETETAAPSSTISAASGSVP